MMEISDQAIASVYKLAKKVHQQEITLTDAIREVEKEGSVNPSSARNLINNFKKLRAGLAYKRAMSIAATKYFIQKIHQDFGVQAFQAAIVAVNSHLDYYHSLGRGQQVSISQLIEGLPVELGVSVGESALYPNEVDPGSVLFEGVAKKVMTNSYERNHTARRKCIEYYGTKCQACGLVFEDKYGDIGVGFIHVHHVVELSTIGSAYQVDPIEDLIPVCANCHAMLHRTKPAMLVDELKLILSENNPN